VFAAARFIGGLGIGISTVAAPLYISEISPPAYRGRLAGMFQFNIVFGIVIAFASNALIARVGGEDAWRWMLGVAAFPSLVYTVMCFALPESPRWLIGRKGDRAAALKVLRIIEPNFSQSRLEAHADEIQAAAASEQAATSGFWSPRLKVPILLAFLIAFFKPALRHQCHSLFRAADL
jgi:MFS family permease